MTEPQAKEFGPVRNFFWPIHRFELKKLVPMLLIFFFISFNYNVLRILKDTLIVTAKSSGAEVIPFIKVWAMFPGAIAMTALFSFFSSRYQRASVFYMMVGIFLTYFLLFACLYPFKDTLHPHAFCDWLEIILPKGCKGLIAMVRYWLFTSFYVMSELWGSVLLTVLFWGFANQITRLSEAKRFYGLFGIGTNFSGVFAGQASIAILSLPFFEGIPFIETKWDQSLLFTLSLLLISGTLALVLFYWLNEKVLTDPTYYDNSQREEENVTKGKISLKENFAYLLRSRYLSSIALIVISYNIVINLVEVLWKHEVRALYPNPSDYAVYMNEVSSIIGVIATLCALVVSGNAIRKFGWTFTALLTPLILFISSVFFFLFFFLDRGGMGEWFSYLGITPLVLVVFFGTFQNILSRAAKYTVFDATKEMAFVPLSPEMKLNGKASIDGVCSRLGKSGGAMIHQSLLILFSTLSASSTYVALVLFSVIFIWMLAVRRVGKEFELLSSPAETKKATSFTEPAPLQA